MQPYQPDSLASRNPRLIARLLPTLESFSRRYFSLRCEGLENVPKGPVIFVANHNGGIFGPDLLCTLPMLWRTLGAHSPLYAMAHDFAMRQFTPLGRVLQTVGAVAAHRDNAHRVLASGGQLLVYPGGDLEAYRHFRRRNEVVILPRSGFIEVAREHKVPVVPVVVHGAHRSAVVFSEGEKIARLLRLRQWGRLERFPLALALPWGIAPGPWMPYLPLPFPLRLRVLPAMTFPEKTVAVQAAGQVQAVMQSALDDMAVA